MRKKSKYKPKGLILDTVGHILSGFQLVKHKGDAAVVLKIKNHAALTNMVKGEGTRNDIDVLIAAMNVSEALIATADLGSEYRAEVMAAQDAIHHMGRRGLERGRFLFTGPELSAINTGMDVHDAQLDACTVGQLEKALDFVVKEIKAKRARAIA